jgi:peptidoglycan-associated lipoprotein
MSVFVMSSQIGKLMLAAALGLTLAACASTNPTDPSQLGGEPLPAQNGFNASADAGNNAPGSPGDFTVNVGDRIFFETDSAEITAEGAGTLDKQAQWLQRYGQYAVTMQGHADERGTREYNFALGARRAEAAKNYLVARGIDGSRIRTISFGKERPVEVCEDISCWMKNRRAVTSLGAGGA